MAVVRNFKFGLYVKGSKFQPADDKSSLKGAWSGSRDILEFYTPCNISTTATARDVKFCLLVSRVKF